MEGHDDAHHEARGHDPGEAAPIGLAGVAEQGVAAVGGGVQGEEQNEHPELASRQEVVRRARIPAGSPGDFGHEHQHEQIDAEGDDAGGLEAHLRSPSWASVSETSVSSQATALRTATAA
jgi:hypothetical protein